MLDCHVFAFTNNQLTAHNRFDARSIFTRYKQQQKTLDLLRQFDCRQTIVKIVNAITSSEMRLRFVAIELANILKAERDWTKIKQISLEYPTADDNFMSNITKLYGILDATECVKISMEENQLIAAAILNDDIPLWVPNNRRTICKECKQPDNSVDCHDHKCKDCLKGRRQQPRRSTSPQTKSMCKTCTMNNNRNNTLMKRKHMRIKCSICCNERCEDFGKSKRCTDCPNRFHQKCHPNKNASTCYECLNGNGYDPNNNNTNRVMLSAIQNHFWPVVIVSEQQVPVNSIRGKFSGLEPGAIIVFHIVKNVYQPVCVSNLLALHLHGPAGIENTRARDAICPPHETGLDDAIQIAKNIRPNW